MGQKDIISKQLIQRIAVDLAVYLLNLKIDEADLELLATESQRVEDRRADLVAKISQPEDNFILHIEIQNNNDAVMPLRMLRYYTDICFAHPHLPVHQYIIYIGHKKLSMPAQIQDNGLDYQYQIIDMHDIDYQTLLKQNTPDAIVLAILGDFKQHSKQYAVKEILLRLHQKLNAQPQRFREYLSMLEILSENRDLKTYIQEVEDVITEINIETLPSFELGMKRGVEKGLNTGIEKGIEQGIEKGVEQERENMVRHLLSQQSAENVAQLTGLPLETILQIKHATEH